MARGRVRLAGRTRHDGTLVACPPGPSLAVTDTSGAYALDLLPRGRWTITMYRLGFGLGLAPIHVSTAGDTLEVPDVQLLSNPGPDAGSP